jgi:hypothetical protein
MKGIIFKYTDKNGEEKKGVAFHDEQKTFFPGQRKVFLRILNKDFTFKKNEDGNMVVALKSYSELTQIGYWD